MKNRKAQRPAPAAYPTPDDMRSGAKVGWYIYIDQAKAVECAILARERASLKAMQGYDFGYQSPGRITTLQDGRFEVCIP